MYKLKYWNVVALLLTVMFFMSACDQDELNDNSIPDPEGTVLVQMRNRDYGHTEVYMEEGNRGGWFYIDSGNNFKGSAYVSFISVGRVNGLKDVRNLPEYGWSESVAVVPHNGYFVRYGSGSSYMRIYIVDYIVSTGGGIIGATVKYQRGFIPENLQ